jgi:uncharacterized membrane protein YdbT with pleckstrin-like domain
LSLLESSLRTIPFNILAVIVLALDFIYTNEAPIKLVVIWFFLILILSVIRWMASKIIISKERYIRIKFKIAFQGEDIIYNRFIDRLI